MADVRGALGCHPSLLEGVPEVGLSEEGRLYGVPVRTYDWMPRHILAVTGVDAKGEPTVRFIDLRQETTH